MLDIMTNKNKHDTVDDRFYADSASIINAAIIRNGRKVRETEVVVGEIAVAK